MGGHLWRFYDYFARCEDCGWESDAKNAQANAAQHSRRYDHSVHVQVTGNVSYLSETENASRQTLKAKGR